MRRRIRTGTGFTFDEFTTTSLALDNGNDCAAIMHESRVGDSFISATNNMNDRSSPISAGTILSFVVLDSHTFARFDTLKFCCYPDKNTKQTNSL